MLSRWHLPDSNISKMERPIVKIEDLKRLASEAGFDLCGVTRAEYMAEAEGRFREWLSGGNGEQLEYLHRNLDLRFDPSKLVDGARSVVVCGVNYKSQYSLSQSAESGVGIASYALMRDYHKSLKKALKLFLKELQCLYPAISGRCFTDSAPLVEKHLAELAGIGRVGRQSLIVTPQFGTFVLLGELVIDHEVDRYDEPLRGDTNPCGECRRCVDMCPAKAINDNRTIDARRCIACRTIECSDPGSEPLHGWIFGCDVCQSCCPHNKMTPLATNPDMQPIITPPTAVEWLSMNEEQFARFTQGTALKRSSLARIVSIISNR